MRSYSGRIPIRVPSELHKGLAHEAFKSGRSINQLCLEAILTRKALKKYDPWKAVVESWKQNQRVKPKQVEADILRAISEVRHGQ
jgi:hypothetical protein